MPHFSHNLPISAELYNNKSGLYKSSSSLHAWGGEVSFDLDSDKMQLISNLNTFHRDIYKNFSDISDNRCQIYTDQK